MRQLKRAAAALFLAAPATIGLAGVAAADPEIPATTPTAPARPVIDLTFLSPLTDVLFAGQPVSPEQPTTEDN